jgi:hypothetical protein
LQSARHPTPDWAYVEKELRHRSVMRLLLWEKYRAAHPDGFGYTWFCTTFEAWRQRMRPSMRQTHIGGKKVFVDFAGDTIDIFDPITGEVRAMKLFALHRKVGCSHGCRKAACGGRTVCNTQRQSTIPVMVSIGVSSATETDFFCGCCLNGGLQAIEWCWF